MPWFDFLWTPETIAHIAEHGVTQRDVEEVVQNPEETGVSRATGDLLAKGEADNGKYIVVIYTMIDDVTVLPITAFEPS